MTSISGWSSPQHVAAEEPAVHNLEFTTVIVLRVGEAVAYGAGGGVHVARRQVKSGAEGAAESEGAGKVVTPGDCADPFVPGGGVGVGLGCGYEVALLDAMAGAAGRFEQAMELGAQPADAAKQRVRCLFRVGYVRLVGAEGHLQRDGRSRPRG